MGRISLHLKGGSNQPQSLALGGGAFESQCFISKHKLLDQGISLPKVVFRTKGCHSERGESSSSVCIYHVIHVPFESIFTDT